MPCHHIEHHTCGLKCTLKYDELDLVMQSLDWNVWIHHPDHSNWDMVDFIKLTTITSASEFWGVFNNIHNIPDTLFLMRDSVDPIWEHPKNRNGGTYITFIGTSVDAMNQIIGLCELAVCDSLFQSESDNEKVTGLSIVRKHNSYAIKVWMSQEIRDARFHPDTNILNPSFRKHAH